jgi:hypothetical protein
LSSIWSSPFAAPQADVAPGGDFQIKTERQAV